MRIQVLAIAVLIGLFSVGCKKKKAELGVAPAFEDAEFSYAPTAESPNIIQFTAVKSGSIIVWDFGNGTSAKGKTATAIYPLKGSYLVKITVFTKGGHHEYIHFVIALRRIIINIKCKLYCTN